MTSLLSLLEGCSCNGHAGVVLFCDILSIPVQPASELLGLSGPVLPEEGGALPAYRSPLNPHGETPQ